MKFFKINRYLITSIVLLLYLIIINRASYLSSLVNFILIAALLLIYKIRITKISILFAFVSLFYLIIGVLNNNNLEYIFTDFLCFMPFVFLFVENKSFKSKFIDNEMAGLNRILPYLLIASLGLFIYMGYDLTSTLVTRFAYNQESKLNLFAPLTPIFFIPFLLCYSKTQYNRIFVNLGAFFILTMGFITQTKTIFIPVILAFILRIVFGRNAGDKVKYFLFFVILGILAGFLLNRFMPESFVNFTEKFNSSDGSNMDRINESLEYLKKCNFYELILGKGFGGTKVFYGEEFIGGINMIHFGFVHLIMKGGIILLGLMYFPLFYIIVKDTLQKEYAYVSMAFVFIAMDLGHTQWISLTSMLIYWLLVYFRFYKKLKI